MDISKDIIEAKERIQSELRSDLLIIFFTRIVEDLKRNPEVEFWGRVKEFYLLINPYCFEEGLKNIFVKFRESSLEEEYGIRLDEQEKGFVDIFRTNLDENCRLNNPKVMRGRLNGMLKILVKKYFIESSELIEPFILGKLIGFFGGVKNIYAKPASTIQLVGAETALFRHMGQGKSCPKYGIIYHSKFIQGEANKGRAARQLANSLAKAIRVDYFRSFYGK